MFRKALNYILIAFSCVIILFAGFVLGVSTAKKSNAISQVYPVTPNLSSSSTPDMALFWKTWQLINDHYLKSADVSDEQRVRGATEGLVASLGDPYSEYFPPQAAAGFRDDVNGNFGGIGAQLGIRDGVLTVVAPLKDSPAAKADVRAGDQILFVDATSTDQLSTEEAARIIRGPVGTTVKLTIGRPGTEGTKEINIKRDQIVAPTIDFTMKDNSIAYIQLYQFNANVDQLFLETIRKAALQGARGIVLDMRGNPGGYLDVAINLSGWFVPRGTVVVSQEKRDGKKDAYRANGNAALVNTPVVVLIDEGSASAAEILAGALRDVRHAKLVGQTSFGKGTVQEIEELPDGSLVKLTIAHWVLPSGQILDKAGLKPDYEVKLTDEDIKNKHDSQLEKALEVIRAQL